MSRIINAYEVTIYDSRKKRDRENKHSQLMLFLGASCEATSFMTKARFVTINKSRAKFFLSTDDEIIPNIYPHILYQY